MDQTEILEKVKAAINGYYAALDRREHGGVAQARAFHEIERALGMNWVRGESLTVPKPGSEDAQT